PVPRKHSSKTHANPRANQNKTDRSSLYQTVQNNSSAYLHRNLYINAVPGTDILIPGTDILIPGTDILIPGTDILIPGVTTVPLKRRGPVQVRCTSTYIVTQA
ncbi:hypothetical protein EMCRGX_G010316, partial [Ephydatia muelleri]